MMGQLLKSNPGRFRPVSRFAPIPVRPGSFRTHLLRDRPFNLHEGGYGSLFRSEFFFRPTRELDFFFSRI
jgi:hypothetical protein